MNLDFDTTAPGARITISLDERERDLLGEDVALPILLHRAMQAIVALRSGERPAGTSTTAGNWAEMTKRTAQLTRILSGVLDGEIRAHAAAGGSARQLGRALGTDHQQAHSRRAELLAKAPGVREPVRTEQAA